MENFVTYFINSNFKVKGSLWCYRMLYVCMAMQKNLASGQITDTIMLITMLCC